MPNGGGKLGSKPKQRKQREELPTGVGNEDRIEAKIDRRPARFFPGERSAQVGAWSETNASREGREG
jgi:hypothetical protein